MPQVNVSSAGGAATHRLSPRARRLRRLAILRRTVILGAAVLLSFADRSGWLLADRPDADRYHLVDAAVVRVIDGDTLEVDLRDHITGAETTRVRIIGINCPEAARAGSSPRPADPFAQEATALSRDLLSGGRVRLRLEPQDTRDAYGRLLAHVDLPDGTGLAERLLGEGLARREDRWNHSMLMRYRQLELAARRAGRGLWAEGP